LAEQIRALSRREGVTLFMTLLAAFNILLGRLTGQEDIVIGTPIANRSRVEIERLIGFFVNTLAIRTDLSGQPTFLELLKRVREVTLSAYMRQEVPFERLVEDLKPVRDLSHNPLFDVMFNLASFTNIRQRFILPGLTSEVLPLTEVESKFDLTLYADDQEPGIALRLVYNADLFRPARMVELMAQYHQLLSQVVASPENRITQYSLVTKSAEDLFPDKTRELSCAWKGAVQTRITRWAHTMPNQPAVLDPQEVWSYGGLEARSNRLAHYLIANGVKRQEVVVVYGHRSAALVWGILGVMKAGAAFMILDPHYPSSRNIEALEQADPCAWLEVKAAGPLPQGLQEYILSRSWRCQLKLGARADTESPLGSYSAHAPRIEVEPDDVTYIAFTSGSSGGPKGIIGTHRPLSHFLDWYSESFRLGKDDRVSMLSGLSHDPLLRDMFTPLWVGAALCIPGADDVYDGRKLAQWMRQEQISITHLTPAMGRLLYDSGSGRDGEGIKLERLRYACFGGDILRNRDVNRIRKLAPNVQCVNFYGATETPQAMGYYVVPAETTGLVAESRVPIGAGIEGVQLLVLNQNAQLAGVGELGEIVVRTAYLAKGYIDEDGLEQQRFICGPEAGPGLVRLYRTGDLGRYLPKGGLEFVGRRDDQVKVRAYRIELGDVEVALAGCAGVKEAVVVVVPDNEEETSLVAYLVFEEGQAASTTTLRDQLREKLPDYMVPSAFVAMERLPLTPNGKVDKRALPLPEQGQARLDFMRSRTLVEEIIAGIWEQVFGVERIGLEENFFERGGHSLLAAQVISRVRDALGVELPLVALFKAPTVAGLAAAVEYERVEGRGFALPPIVPARRDGGLPLSFAQQRLWFIHQMEPASAAYNIPLAVRMQGDLDIFALRQGLIEIVRRHEVLRTRYESSNGQTVQVIDESAGVELAIWDVTGLEAEEREERSREIAKGEAARPFDLKTGPVLRVAIVRMRADEHVLLLIQHHVASDAWSANLLVRELSHLYDTWRAGKPSSLPDLRIQYADYSIWQRQLLQGKALEQQVSYWKMKLQGTRGRLELPGDYRRPQERNGFGRGYREVIDRELIDEVKEFSRRNTVTTFITMLAALKIVLMKWSKQRDITVGTVIADRNLTETEQLIGCFMNFLPLNTQMRVNESGEELLLRIKDDLLEAYGYQNCPFEKIVEAINPDRRGTGNPLFNVGFLLLDAPVSGTSSGGLQVEAIDLEMGRALLDLRLVVVERMGEMELHCEYSTALFAEETIKEFVWSWREALRNLARNPEERIGRYQLSEKLERVAEESRRRDEKEVIIIAATFTAEMVAETVEYLMDEIGIAAEVKFAPYNQVFQELLDETSLVRNNRRGINVMLVMLEDWARPNPGLAKEGWHLALKHSVNEFIASVRVLRRRSSVGCVVVICPPSPAAIRDGAAYLEEMERRIQEGLSQESAIEVVSSGELMRLYPVESYYDRHGDEIGHAPYTRVMYAALGTMIARRATSFLSKGYKVIALDCDGTLWKGIVGEDQTDPIEVDDARRTLQHFMVRQQEAGRLLCLCSKNNDAEVMDVFKQKKEMILRPEHIAARRINWDRKSENLRSLAEELNVGLDSFIFIDDSDLECAEVEAICGEVLVLKLPADERQIPIWLDHVWAFDTLKMTEGDRLRTSFYQRNSDREQIREEAKTIEDFIEWIDLSVKIRAMAVGDVERISQLTQRTSQFNNTGIWLTVGEIESLVGADGYDCDVVNVSDRFGEYGLVGVMIYGCFANTLRVKTFLLSCRALGRRVEHQMLERLKDRARKQGAPLVEIEYIETTKNIPVRSFLDVIAANEISTIGNTCYYRIDVEQLSESSIEIYCSRRTHPDDPVAEELT
jgi:amino acid adenylation domain-containing protein/FkbH-like protein